MTFKSFFKGLGEAFRLLLTPSWGSKRRAEQQAYEERLDEAMKRAQAGRDKKADVESWTRGGCSRPFS